MFAGSDDPITSADLRAALGWSLSAFYRARKSGKLPEPTAYTPGNHARWSIAAAAAAVRARGRQVPAAWGAQERVAA